MMKSMTSSRSDYQSIRSSMLSKTSLGLGVRPDPSHLTQEGLDLATIVPSMKGRATSRWHREDLVNQRYLQKFVLNTGLPSEVRVQRQLETPAEHPGSTLVQYQIVHAIFANSLIKGTTTKERTLYVNEARRDNHLAIVTRPPTSPGGLIFFSK